MAINEAKNGNFRGSWNQFIQDYETNLSLGKLPLEEVEGIAKGAESCVNLGVALPFLKADGCKALARNARFHIDFRKKAEQDFSEKMNKIKLSEKVAQVRVRTMGTEMALISYNAAYNEWQDLLKVRPNLIPTHDFLFKNFHSQKELNRTAKVQLGLWAIQYMDAGGNEHRFGEGLGTFGPSEIGVDGKAGFFYHQALKSFEDHFNANRIDYPSLEGLPQKITNLKQAEEVILKLAQFAMDFPSDSDKRIEAPFPNTPPSATDEGAELQRQIKAELEIDLNQIDRNELVEYLKKIGELTAAAASLDSKKFDSAQKEALALAQDLGIPPKRIALIRDHSLSLWSHYITRGTGGTPTADKLKIPGEGIDPNNLMGSNKYPTIVAQYADGTIVEFPLDSEEI